MNKWKLTEGTNLVIISQSEAYLFPVDKPEWKKKILKKYSGFVYRDIDLEKNEFSLSLDEALDVYITFEGKLYRVANYRGDIRKAIIQNTLEKSKFKETFEAAYNDDLPGSVNFVSSGMAEYNEYMNEMIRQLNCQIKKKTKKWVAGHRYDSEKETYYYLGEFCSHKSDDYGSEYIKEPDCPLVNVVALKVDGCTTISDVFKDIEGHKVKILQKLPGMVDSGNALTDDTSLYGLLDKIDLTRTLENILGNICFVSGSVPEKVKDVIVEKLKKKLEEVLISCWGEESYFPKDLQIGRKNSLTDNIEHLSILVCSKHGMNDANYLCQPYYTEFFKDLGIDLKKLAEEAIGNFSLEKTVFGSFESYLENQETYLKYRKYNSNILTKVQLSTNGGCTKSDLIELRESINNRSLYEALKTIFGNAKSSGGGELTSYRVFNAGTQKEPKEYIRAEITVPDIINFYGGNVPGDVMKGILKDQFVKVIIEIDTTEELR